MKVRKAEIGTNAAVVVMGVCGVGKSLLAGRLSQALGVGMVEADDFHNEESKRKMLAGVALTEADRMPWLDAVAAAALRRISTTGIAVVACSALRRVYRERLNKALPGCVFIHLTGPEALIEDRLNNRKGHFVGKALLGSQLETLEPLEETEPGFTLDISLPIDTLVAEAMDHLRQFGLSAETAVGKRNGTTT
ncbi:gluconokinase [Roseibium sp.]|uniref:gluconokinase n=1 Tax=Roseibium sp. TaxID=1936156 RepID=UPI003D1032FF